MTYTKEQCLNDLLEKVFEAIVKLIQSRHLLEVHHQPWKNQHDQGLKDDDTFLWCSWHDNGLTDQWHYGECKMDGSSRDS